MSITLRFDRGTLILEGWSEALPPQLGQFRFDARVEAYRAPAMVYPEVVKHLKGKLGRNQAPVYRRLELEPRLSFQLYPHQQEALEAWKAHGQRGLVILPTGAGKTIVGVLALAQAGRSGLVVVPTLDLMHQWFALLKAAFPEVQIGLLGGGYHEPFDLCVATYDSAGRHMERLGNKWGTLVFDEVHHLPTEFYRVIAEFSLAPNRLGLSATPERTDMRHEQLPELVGPVVYRREAVELAGKVLAPYEVRRMYVDLSLEERLAYQRALDERESFLKTHNLRLGSLEGWNRFVMLSARSEAGRRAMKAHREARRISSATPAKLRALEALLAQHPGQKTLVFTDDNASAYEVSQRYLIPALTHQTSVKERQEILEYFKTGRYKAIVTSRVLNEGVDVPDAAIAVVLSGTSVPRELVQRLGRILRRQEGKQALLYEVVSKGTREERVAERRREGVNLEGKKPGPSQPSLIQLPPVSWEDLGE
jgi:superfamily II DNA or RNA helicase